ncbi:MAG: hypothetical protein M1833_007405 [Piccolia ochrophora]|nr:MAG: hypothetical protein M1833_007405 [Piccolia ochrophora]
MVVAVLHSRLLLRNVCPVCHGATKPASWRTYASAAKQASSEPARKASATSPSNPSPASGKLSNLTVRSYKPQTPGLRHLRRPINDHLWKGKPHRKLTLAKKGQGKGGRNHSGQITVRHRGGGHKRRIRIVDFSRTTAGKHVVDRIERDPGRSAHLALLTHETSGEKSYIVAAEGMRAGNTVESYRAGIPEDLMSTMGGTIDPGILAARTAWRGNCLPLHMIPIGTLVFNVGSAPERGAVFCRSAGTFATVVAKDDENKRGGPKYVTVKLQSGEVRRVSKDACATVGVASNPNHQHRQLGKAGRSRWLGIRPTVRGLAMNAADHPHGGGRGKSKGNVHPKSIWGKPTKSGFKTRKRSKPNKYVVVPRVRNQGQRRKAKQS